MDSRSFAGAIALLRSRSRRRSTVFVETGLQKAVLPGGNLAGRGKPPILGMRAWLQQLGHTEKDIDGLNIIHVAGTKGKGSTCAYVESFLRAHGKGILFPRKTGLYTSPHLVSETERIRIDFKPISEELFTKYVFEVYDTFSLTDDGPGFLQLMALVSFHAFIREGVEVAIYETHHGGEFCATNVVKNPVVTAITNIGIDHIIDLGPTLENIAWHKAGILKQGVPALTVRQAPEVLTVLEERAAKQDVQMRIVEINRSLPKVFPSDAMRLNCSLALAVTNAFLQRVAPSDQSKSLSEEEIVQGLQQFYWPGRFEQIPGQGCTWFLDGAHNELSVVEAARWFQQISQRSPPTTKRVLMFAQISEKRDGLAIVERLAEGLQIPMHLVIFTTYQTEGTCSEDDAKIIRGYQRAWKARRPQDSQVCTAPSIKSAIELSRECSIPGSHTQILVTGSLSLIGGLLQLEL